MTETTIVLSLKSIYLKSVLPDLLQLNNNTISQQITLKIKKKEIIET